MSTVSEATCWSCIYGQCTACSAETRYMFETGVVGLPRKTPQLWEAAKFRAGTPQICGSGTVPARCHVAYFTPRPSTGSTQLNIAAQKQSYMFETWVVGGLPRKTPQLVEAAKIRAGTPQVCGSRPCSWCLGMGLLVSLPASGDRHSSVAM